MDIKLRKWEMSDSENLVYNANNPHIKESAGDFLPYPYTKEYSELFISFINRINEKEEINKAITINNKACGCINLNIDINNNSGEIGYWLGEKYWNKGIITKAIKAMLYIAFNKAKLDKIYAYTYKTNIGSIKALEKNNFTFVSVLQVENKEILKYEIKK